MLGKDKVSIKNKKSKVVIKKKTNPIEINKNDNFIKIYPTEGGVTNQPKCDIRSLDVVQGVVTNEKGKEKISWYVTFNLIDGTQIVDRTPYKTMEKAEKVMDSITNTLPQPKPITTIQQPVNIAPPDNNSYEQVGEAFPIGFKPNEDEEYE